MAGAYMTQRNRRSEAAESELRPLPPAFQRDLDVSVVCLVLLFPASYPSASVTALFCTCLSHVKYALSK